MTVLSYIAVFFAGAWVGATAIGIFVFRSKPVPMPDGKEVGDAVEHVPTR